MSKRACISCFNTSVNCSILFMIISTIMMCDNEVNHEYSDKDNHVNANDDVDDILII